MIDSDRSSPAPSSPSRFAPGSSLAARTGRDVAAQAEAVEAPAKDTPGVSAGTSHKVIGPSPATGRLDHT